MLGLNNVATGVRQARERQERDLELGPARGLVWDQGAADHAVDFFADYLRHSIGEWAGQPFELAPWQADDIIRPLFGWKRKDGTRRFRKAFVEVARKNGKSTMAAGVGLYLTVADQEIGAHVFNAATTHLQAQIVHKEAIRMVRGSPRLRRFVETIASRNNIHCPRLGSKFEAVASETGPLHGLNPHGIIIDEIHAHKNRGIYDVFNTATGSRRQPLMFIITTAGLYDPESIGWEQHHTATKVLDGTIENDDLFAYIAAADKDDDYKDPEVWEKANPNIRVSVKEDYLAAQCKEASEVPAAQNTFLQLHLNMWTNQVTRWIDMDVWRACGTTVDESELGGQQCYGGLDLASTQDITAFVLAFPKDGVCRLLIRLWVPEDRVAWMSRRGEGIPYDAWVRDGHLLTTPGNVTDYEVIRKQIVRDAATFDLQEIGFDPWQAMELAPKLQQEDGVQMVELRQGFASMHGPTKEFERLLLKQAIHHGDHPVLNWMASNVAIATDSNANMRPVKDKSTGKIDGIVAAIMAVGRAAASLDDPYADGHGLIVL